MLSRLARRLTGAVGLLTGLLLAATAGATTVEPPSFDALTNDSDVVVHSVVRRVSSEKRTGPYGTKIVTHVELEVLETVVGSAPATLTLDFLGGRVGEEQMIVNGAPRFVVGEEDILFVRDNGRSICPLYAMAHGRYRVRQEAGTQRSYMTRDDGVPLTAVDDVSLPLVGSELLRRQKSVAAALSPADFVRQIRANLNSSARAHLAR